MSQQKPVWRISRRVILISLWEFIWLIVHLRCHKGLLILLMLKRLLLLLLLLPILLFILLIHLEVSIILMRMMRVLMHLLLRRILTILLITTPITSHHIWILLFIVLIWHHLLWLLKEWLLLLVSRWNPLREVLRLLEINKTKKFKYWRSVIILTLKRLISVCVGGWLWIIFWS